MRTKKFASVVVLAVMTCVGGIVATAPAQAAIAPGVNVMEWNMCGLDCNNGLYTANLKKSEAIITEWHPAIFLAVEICETRVSNFAAINGGWFGGHVFYPKRSTGNANCGRIGTAIFTHRAATNLGSVQIPVRVASGALDTVGCAKTEVGANHVVTVACVTHLESSSDVTVQQAQLQGTTTTGTAPGNLTAGTSLWQGAAGWALDKANGKPLVFGGDFNLKRSRPEINHMYTNVIENGSALTGQWFRELDQTANLPTHFAASENRKLDYIFFKHSYASNYSMPAGSPLKLAASDHAVLYGQARLCSTTAEC